MIEMDPLGDFVVACPTTPALEAGLARFHHARVVHRTPNVRSSTFPSESVTITNGPWRRMLFCKHGPGYEDRNGALHRGVAYEALVYERFIRGEPAVPACIGSFAGPHGTTLLLEHLPRATSVARWEYTPQGPMATAVAELGRWHAAHGAMADDAGVLNRYGDAHLGRWAEKARLVNRDVLEGVIPPTLVDRVVNELLAAPPTLIHGELFPANVVSSAGRVWFVDWESAGLGAGEIDLAAITSGAWDGRVRRELDDVYASSRWPDGAPKAFRAAVAAARIYIVVVIAWHTFRRGTKAGIHGLAREASEAASLVLESSA
jgi:hypothetical protein